MIPNSKLIVVSKTQVVNTRQPQQGKFLVIGYGFHPGGSGYPGVNYFIVESETRERKVSHKEIDETWEIVE